jgi:hypothetical protein
MLWQGRASQVYSPPVLKDVVNPHAQVEDLPRRLY